ncbi:MAG: hypothetical protein WBB82_11785 [Limnothrix sp.]
MLKTVTGTYRDGQVQWDETPPDQGQSQVLVTFLEAGKSINIEKLKLFIEHLETIQGIQQGLAEVDAGQSRPLGDFMAEMQQKYDISG